MSNLVLSVDKDVSLESRQISDYTKYLFDDDEESEHDGEDGDYVAQEDHNDTIIADKAPPPVTGDHTTIELNRKDTTSSEESYNSIQKEENFQVAPQLPATSAKLSPTTPLKQRKEGNLNLNKMDHLQHFHHSNLKLHRCHNLGSCKQASIWEATCQSPI